LFNSDISGSNVPHDRFVRKRKDYDTLDYSDVANGNHQGNIENSGNIIGWVRSSPGKGQNPMGRGLMFTDLKP